MADPPNPTRSLKILVVEDDPGLLEVVCRCLASTGYEVTPAADSHTALEEARSARFDLVILDLMLPDCDGVILQGKLNKLSPGLQSRTIFMTGFSSEQPVVAYLKSLSAVYLHKPFTTDELLKAVEQAA